MGLQHHFITAAWNNAWANHRLLGAVCTLDDAAFAAPRTSFFPSLKATLNHLLTVDWYYVDALERAVAGTPVNAAARACFDPVEPFDRAGPLREAQRAVDRRLIAVCEALRDDRMDLAVPVQRRAGVSVDTATRLLAHLFQHQIHHRGQAHAMLAGTGVKPPQLDDFYCAGDAAVRADDLAALGTSEAALWG